MKKLIITALCLWTAACLFVHGPVILVYICFQALTSGVFALEMRRIEKRNLKKTQDPPDFLCEYKDSVYKRDIDTKTQHNI